MFTERIKLNFPLQDLAQEICNQYQIFDKITSCKLIEIGYEDFNFVIETESQNYLAKVFSKKSSDEDCQEKIKKQLLAFKNNISCPEIFANKHKKFLTELSLKQTNFRLCLMQYIDGQDFYTSNKNLTTSEIEFVANQLAHLNKIEYAAVEDYDQWCIINFVNEFEKHSHLLCLQLKEKLEKVYKKAKNFDFATLPQGYVHGDIICTNLIKDKSNKIFLIDFSVANHMPRLVDLAVAIGDLCIDTDDLDLSKTQTTSFLQSYQKVSLLEPKETENLKLALLMHQANSILQCEVERLAKANDTQENKMFFDTSLARLEVIEQIDF